MRRVHQRVCRPILRSANKRNWQTTRKTVLASQLAQWAGNGITEKGKPRVDGVNLVKGSTALLRHAKPLPQVAQSCHFPPFLSLLGVLSPGVRKEWEISLSPAAWSTTGAKGREGLSFIAEKFAPKSPACCRSRHTGLSADDRVAYYDPDGWESIGSAYGDRRWGAREIARLTSRDTLITMEMKSKMKCNEFSSGCVRRTRNEPRFRSGLHGDQHLMDWLFQLQRAEWVACTESSSPKTIRICAWFRESILNMTHPLRGTTGVKKLL
ncbi:hypothetical protein OIDMADRAFT_51601 [Oidiodendron maius Zn]|uniref:Uncharacterized protein n=1 Tax=Oidiodendron maius (strain Zn) TaxID=913774 RepID=A0A0C3CXC6_OIDMZ|nr:hypothetical protein OIDMADRAFT_51601 [Oidiodendron maius Zn]